MIHYTDRIKLLMQDIVTRVPQLEFIDLDKVLVFARYGRSHAEGPYATCHSLNLPTSEPGYFYWRDRQTGAITRCSEWFVTKTPSVTIDGTPIHYLISFALPRFCNQALPRTRKEAHYPGAPNWIAKLDTVVHELYHIDPNDSGIRKMERAEGHNGIGAHGCEFMEVVAGMVMQYLSTNPDPARYEFLRFDFAELTARHGGVVGTTFRGFPSYPQRYQEPMAAPPDVPPNVKVEPLRGPVRQATYTECDLELRQFFAQPASSSARRPAAAGRRWSRRLEGMALTIPIAAARPDPR